MMISEDETAANDIWIGIDRMGTYLELKLCNALPQHFGWFLFVHQHHSRYQKHQVDFHPVIAEYQQHLHHQDMTAYLP